MQNPTINFAIKIATIPLGYADGIARKLSGQISASLNGKTISLVTGVPFKDLIASYVSNAKEYTYYQAMPDIIWL